MALVDMVMKVVILVMRINLSLFLQLLYLCTQLRSLPYPAMFTSQMFQMRHNSNLYSSSFDLGPKALFPAVNFYMSYREAQHNFELLMMWRMDGSIISEEIKKRDH